MAIVCAPAVFQLIPGHQTLSLSLKHSTMIRGGKFMSKQMSRRRFLKMAASAGIAAGATMVLP